MADQYVGFLESFGKDAGVAVVPRLDSLNVDIGLAEQCDPQTWDYLPPNLWKMPKRHHTKLLIRNIREKGPNEWVAGRWAVAPLDGEIPI